MFDQKGKSSTLDKTTLLEKKKNITGFIEKEDVVSQGDIQMKCM